MFVSQLTGPDPLTAMDGCCGRYRKVSSLVLDGQSIGPFCGNAGAPETPVAWIRTQDSCRLDHDSLAWLPDKNYGQN